MIYYKMSNSKKIKEIKEIDMKKIYDNMLDNISNEEILINDKRFTYTNIYANNLKNISCIKIINDKEFENIETLVKILLKEKFG